MTISLKWVDIVIDQYIYDPHGNDKSNIYNRYTKLESRESNHTSKENQTQVKKL